MLYFRLFLLFILILFPLFRYTSSVPPLTMLCIKFLVKKLSDAQATHHEHILTTIAMEGFSDSLRASLYEHLFTLLPEKYNDPLLIQKLEGNTHCSYSQVTYEDYPCEKPAYCDNLCQNTTTSYTQTITNEIQSVAFSHDGNYIVTLSAQVTDYNGITTYSLTKILCVWDVVTGKCIKKICFTPSVTPNHTSCYKAFLSSDNNELLLNAGGLVHIWNITTDKYNSSFPHRSPSHYLALSNQQKYIVIPSNRSVHLLNIYTEEVLKSFEHTNMVHLVALSQDDQYLLTTDYTGTVYLWNQQKGTLIKELELPFTNKQHIYSLSFSPNNKHLLILTNEAIFIYELTTGNHLHTLTLSQPFKHIKQAFFTQDGTYIIARIEEPKYIPSSPSLSSLYMWNTKTGDFVATENIDGQSCSKLLEVCPSNNYIATAANQDTLYIYALRSLEKLSLEQLVFIILLPQWAHNGKHIKLIKNSYWHITFERLCEPIKQLLKKEYTITTLS